MSSSLVIIGWGSLIWDLDNLFPHTAGGWRQAAGPRLPIEFVRVSPKRRHGLTVVIDDEHGVHCPTSVIASRRTDIQQVVADLANRERTSPSSIGALDRRSGLRQGLSPSVEAAVSGWLQANDIQGAVWTDLRGNFSDYTGSEYTIEAAMHYLRHLNEEAFTEARRYIKNAPLVVDTPLRRALQGQAWWQDEAGESNGQA